MPLEREQTTLRLPAELLEQLKQEAECKGTSFNALVLGVFDEYFKTIQV